MHEICDNSTPLWIIIFSTSEKGCFTEILVAKSSFRILNFLIPIPTKLLYFYFIWPLEFLVLRALPWETRVQKFLFCYLEICQTMELQFDLPGLAQKNFRNFLRHCGHSESTIILTTGRILRTSSVRSFTKKHLYGRNSTTKQKQTQIKHVTHTIAYWITKYQSGLKILLAYPRFLTFLSSLFGIAILKIYIFRS